MRPERNQSLIQVHAEEDGIYSIDNLSSFKMFSPTSETMAADKCYRSATRHIMPPPVPNNTLLGKFGDVLKTLVSMPMYRKRLDHRGLLVDDVRIQTILSKLGFLTIDILPTLG